MTSPTRSKKYGAQCTIQNLDWDSPSIETGTVKRRRSCPENSTKSNTQTQEAIFEIETPSDSGSGTSRSVDDEKTDSLEEVEQRISNIINESRSSKSNSESSEIDINIDSLLDNTEENNLYITAQNGIPLCDRSKTFIKAEETISTSDKPTAAANEPSPDKKIKDRKPKTPAPIKKFNKSLDIVKGTTSFTKEAPQAPDKTSVLPIYKSTVQASINFSGNNNQKRKVTSKLKLPFSPTKAMDKPKIIFFQGKGNLPDCKPSPLLSSPVRRTISNEYVRLKFANDTVVRRTIDGKSVPKITPKIQSIIPESPVDNEDPFLNLSPNKKYTVTVNNKVRCDKDNYVIFDPKTGFKVSDVPRQSKIPLKSPTGERSRLPLKSPGESSGAIRKSANVSDTDSGISGILSPNSPMDTSDRSGSGHYVNATVFSDAAKKSAAELDITILNPELAKKAAEQIQVVLIFGFSGACRTNELTFLTTNNIEKHSDTLMLVKLPDTKNNKERNFVIRDEYVKIVEKYQALRPPNTPTNRFFLQYHKGKCVRQPMGINKIASFPRIIATFLGLQAPEQYTGHCFRRTSATLLADSGAGLSTLKRHGGWKSSTVAEAYIEDSIENKAKICKSIVGDIKLKQHNFQPSTLPSTSKDMPVFIDSEPSANLSLSPTYTPVEFNNVDNTNNSTCISVPNKNVIFNIKNCQNFTFIFDKNQK